jgi:hypothetical protein
MLAGLSKKLRDGYEMIELLEVVTISVMAG